MLEIFPDLEVNLTERFYIKGGTPLKGEVSIGGAKNSVLKLIAAALLVKGATKIYNVPELTKDAVPFSYEQFKEAIYNQEGDTVTYKELRKF